VATALATRLRVVVYLAASSDRPSRIDDISAVG